MLGPSSLDAKTSQGRTIEGRVRLTFRSIGPVDIEDANSSLETHTLLGVLDDHLVVLAERHSSHSRRGKETLPRPYVP